MQKITPNLWFDKQAEEAANFYVTVFENSKILWITWYWKEGYDIHHMKEWTVMTVEFQIEWQKFIALNWGPMFNFNEAISFKILCKNQIEVDYYSELLSAVPEAEQCWWVKDKYGVSWQIIPSILPELLQGENSEKVMKAMLKMKKINIAKLLKAWDE